MNRFTLIVACLIIGGCTPLTSSTHAHGEDRAQVASLKQRVSWLEADIVRKDDLDELPAILSQRLEEQFKELGKVYFDPNMEIMQGNLEKINSRMNTELRQINDRLDRLESHPVSIPVQRTTTFEAAPSPKNEPVDRSQDEILIKEINAGMLLPCTKKLLANDPGIGRLISSSEDIEMLLELGGSEADLQEIYDQFLPMVRGKPKETRDKLYVFLGGLCEGILGGHLAGQSMH